MSFSKFQPLWLSPQPNPTHKGCLLGTKKPRNKDRYRAHRSKGRKRKEYFFTALIRTRFPIHEGSKKMHVEEGSKFGRLNSGGGPKSIAPAGVSRVESNGFSWKLG